MGELITGTAVAVVGVIAVRIVLAGRKQAREHARVRDFHRDVLSIVARRDNSESDVLWLDHPLPMAYSVAGKLDLLLRRKACHPLSVEASGMLSSRTSVHT